jgi:hypothetical protein
MTRSPLAYPLTRGVDGDPGGAADLQTDIMRFMAILALCLVAIFALVQSIPLAPDSPAAPVNVSEAPAEISAPSSPPVVAPVADKQSIDERPVPLTRPRWESTFVPSPAPVTRVGQADVPPVPPAAALPELTGPASREPGFTLRFESDLALTRLVAAGQIGFYAITEGRSRRMAIGDSRISFWDASTPSAYHEMEAATVPAPVIEALARTGADTDRIDWGVTLPGKLSRKLDSLMRQHEGGSLVIGANGTLRLEDTQ